MLLPTKNGTTNHSALADLLLELATCSCGMPRNRQNQRSARSP